MSPRPARRAALTALLLTGAALCHPGLAAPSKPAAAPISAEHARQIRAVVRAQLDAFAADDAARAFSFATPAIRKVFGGPDQFLAMVKAQYPVVYRPASVTFLKAAWIDGALTQGVQLSDGNGAVWLAVYHLERQPDKRWRIAGCEVVPSEGRMI